MPLFTVSQVLNDFSACKVVQRYLQLTYLAVFVMDVLVLQQVFGEFWATFSHLLYCDQMGHNIDNCQS